MMMDWREQIENFAVYFSLPLFVYIAVGQVLRSYHPTGILSWQGRRWRNGLTFGLLLLSGWLETAELQYHSHIIPRFLAIGMYSALGVLFLMLVRWWWLDSRKEESAREALLEKLHQEGTEFTAPPTTPGKKVWRWVVNGYALLLIAAGLYALVQYLLQRV
jgi:hypothetical protein